MGERARLMEELQASATRPGPPDGQSLLTARLLREIFRERDIQGLRELESIYRDQPGALQEFTGGSFLELLQPEEWMDAIAFVDGMQDERIRFDLLASMMGRAMTTDSTRAFAILADYKPLPAKTLASGFDPFDFKLAVWNSTGYLVGKGANQRTIDRRFLASIEGNPRAMEEYIKGMRSSISHSLESGAAFDFGTYAEGLPAAQQADLAASLVSSVSGNRGKDAGLVGQLIKALEPDPDAGRYYLVLGKGVSQDVFQQFAMNSSTPLTGSSLESFVGGWVSQRPKSSVEWIASQTSNPEILKPAFSSWTESDSMEASQWLQSQSAGPVKDSCTEQLCDYLLKKGSTEEAKGYLETLPADARERLAAKYPSP